MEMDLWYALVIEDLAREDESRLPSAAPCAGRTPCDTGEVEDETEDGEG